VAAPPAPTLPALRVASWQPPPAVPAESAAFGSQRDYFELVRMRVEHNKRYPDLARKRQLEGRVGVRFVIASDGRLQKVMLVRRAAAEVLNQAALAAVRAAEPFPRPPAEFFSGPLPLELSIVFELL
jgi:protein TonB